MDKALFNTKYAYALGNSTFYIQNGHFCSDDSDIDDNPGYILANLNNVKIIGRTAHDTSYPDGYMVFTESDKAFINNDGIINNVNSFEFVVNNSDVMEYLNRESENCKILDSLVIVSWDLIQFMSLEDDALDWFIESFADDPQAAGYEIFDYSEICNWLDKYQVNRDYTLIDGELREIDIKTSWDIYYLVHDALLVDNEPEYVTITKINDLLIKKVLLKM